MNQLQKEILQAIDEAGRNYVNNGPIEGDVNVMQAIAVSKIVLKSLEGAYNGGFAHGYNWEDHGFNPERTFNRWLKDNGLTE